MRARDNPFATAHLDQLSYRLQGPTWETLIERLERLRWRAAIVGLHGSGKTALLDALEPRLRQRGFAIVRLRLCAETPRLAPGALDAVRGGFGSGHLVLLDGAEQLSPWAWLRFQRQTRQAGGLIVTSHRPGRLPTLLTCETSPALLRDLVESLSPEGPGLDEMTAQALFRRHAGDVREALCELYDAWADVGGVSGPSARRAPGPPLSAGARSSG